MLIIGCRPPCRHTEQHDVFFGIGETLNGLIPDMKRFWPEAKGRLHLDAWREVTAVDGYKIEVTEKTTAIVKGDQLFFINLGGYQKGLFDELHFKLLTVQKTKALAVKHAKSTAFYKEMGLPRCSVTYR